MVNCEVEADRGEEPLSLNYFILFAYVFMCMHVHILAHMCSSPRSILGVTIYLLFRANVSN